MTAYLLHVRSRISFCHIEDELDDFEQRFLPDRHYVLSREGNTANYVVLPDQNLKEFYSFVQRQTADLLIDHLSVVEIGRSFDAVEQGCVERYATDACGEWKRVRDEESFQFEEVRVRTGLNPWLRKYARGGQDLPKEPVGIFLYFQHKLEPDARWLMKLKGALGKSARTHMRDEQSLLITAEWPGVVPTKIFRAERYRRYFEAGFIHTAFCFTLGRREMHLMGDIQSVRPPNYEDQISEPNRRSAPPTLRVVGGGRSEAELRQIRAAVARLKSRSKSQ